MTPVPTPFSKSIGGSPFPSDLRNFSKSAAVAPFCNAEEQRVVQLLAGVFEAHLVGA